MWRKFENPETKQTKEELHARDKSGLLTFLETKDAIFWRFAFFLVSSK